jgi:hypothetical protein
MKLQKYVAEMLPFDSKVTWKYYVNERGEWLNVRAYQDTPEGPVPLRVRKVEE